MDFQLFIDSLLTGTPIAILVSLVAVVWQAIYTRSRDKINDEQAKRLAELEKIKFEQQKDIERLRFEYEQRRWREELARDITLKMIDLRIEEYTKIWSLIEGASVSSTLSVEDAKEIAKGLRQWRYHRGEIITEKLTIETIIALQKALWEYDGSGKAYRRVREIRHVFLQSLRADLGLTQDALGQSLFEVVEERQNIRNELSKLQAEL